MCILYIDLPFQNLHCNFAIQIFSKYFAYMQFSICGPVTQGKRRKRRSLRRKTIWRRRRTKKREDEHKKQVIPLCTQAPALYLTEYTLFPSLDIMYFQFNFQSPIDSLPLPPSLLSIVWTVTNLLTWYPALTCPHPFLHLSSCRGSLLSLTVVPLFPQPCVCCCW